MCRKTCPVRGCMPWRRLPSFAWKSCRNMEIAAYCLGGEAICQLNQVMALRKVKLGRCVSHAAALALVSEHWREYLLLREVSCSVGKDGQLKDGKER